jgi:ribosomal protein S18 acetylase RimI-like enzyme
VSLALPTFTLRRPRPSDRERAAAIVRATGIFRPAEVEVALEVFDGAARRPGVEYHGLAAYDDAGQMLGFALYGPTPCTEGTWDLYWIAVDPAAHRQGVGRALMEGCERAMQQAGARLVVVETSSRSDYEPTRRFYQALAYRAAARIADFYAPGDDLIVYTKGLIPSRSKRPHG